MERCFRSWSTRLILAVASLAATCGAAAAATYYVRTDGGSASQCTGLANAAYSGSGSAQPCAWDHPFRALPPGGTPRIQGGDTLIIGSGSYRMGYGAPGADTCDALAAYDCYMPAIPSGPSASSPTRIRGAGWNSGCTTPPQLWGTERASLIVNLTDSNNVEVSCLELTDHSGCAESHPTLACERTTPPYGDWAVQGIYAEDSKSVLLKNLNIHGFGHTGVLAARLTDWTVEDVRIAGNPWVGWNGDLADGLGNSNAGTMTFRRWKVEWNGCAETYPGKQPTGCWAQTAGGYGDGFGTGNTGGRWIVEDSVIRYNTSDGLDFLYVTEAGSSVEVRRTLVEGNAGNQVKTYRGPFLLENSVIVGNCGYFNGQSFTYNVDDCRALGVALAIGLSAGDKATVVNNTFNSEGDCLVTADCAGTCNGTEKVLLRNNIFQGQVDFLQPFEQTCLVYQETFPASANPFDVDYSVINGVKNDACPGAHDICGVSVGVVNNSVDAFDAHLLASSPAIDSGLPVGTPGVPVPTNDLEQRSRPAGSGVDRGAHEYGAPAYLWTGATDLGSGWKYLSWFGYFYDAGNGWIYHNEHHWMYAIGSSQSSIWFWTSDMGWLWTGSTTYPYLYRHNDTAWLWYLAGSVGPRWFYNLTAGTWESR